MKLSELGEFGLIRRIRALAPRRSGRVKTGIGDDAAVLRQTPSELLLATTDMLIEGVHFDPTYTDFYSLGWKSAAVNLSDIAAMGGRPRYCLTSLGISRSCTAEQIMKFYRGCAAALRKYGAVLIGGDTCSSPGGFIVSITLLGETEGKRRLLRSGARPGDHIFVTGALGDAAAGLELLQNGGAARSRAARTLIERHLRPLPRVEWGRAIAKIQGAHAMIDISDGLSSDLAHVCEESGVGALVRSDAIPLSGELRARCSRLKQEPLWYALHGGEDYELLFTASPAKTAALRKLDIPLFEIGSITRGRSCLITDGHGRKKRLQPAGFDHFRKDGSSVRTAERPGSGKR
jgi:thiamine-monophosphate kinase